jgi:alcohol dehydrogenase class IV
MNTFLVPPQINFGEDSLDSLSDLDGKKVAIVTDEGVMEELGFLDKCKDILSKVDLEYVVIDDVEANPSVKTVLKGKTMMLDFKPDWVIALGGGSTMDAAKIMWAFYEHPDLEFEDIIEVGSIPKLRNKAKFAAIPSTSGTASEITAFSVITDTENHIKYPIVSTEIIPDLAIIDPELPSTMPPEITANTGMDVLAHSIEAFVSTGASDYSDALALKAIKLVFENLEAAYNDGSNMEARTKMHNASTMAGMAFSNSSLGIIHTLAHKIGGEFNVTHGLANAILLPYVIEFNYEEAEAKFKLIEDILGIESLADEIRKLNQKLSIPNNFSETGIDSDEFKKVLDRMSEHAQEDPCTATNPRKTDPEDMKDIYLKSFE